MSHKYSSLKGILNDVIFVSRLIGPTIANSLYIEYSITIYDKSSDKRKRYDRLLSPIFYPRVEKWLSGNNTENEIALVNQYPVYIYQNLSKRSDPEIITSYHSLHLKDSREFHDPSDIYVVNKINTKQLKQTMRLLGDGDEIVALSKQFEDLYSKTITKEILEKTLPKTNKDMYRYGSRIILDELRACQQVFLHQSPLRNDLIQAKAQMPYYTQNLPRVTLQLTPIKTNEDEMIINIIGSPVSGKKEEKLTNDTQKGYKDMFPTQTQAFRPTLNDLVSKDKKQVWSDIFKLRYDHATSSPHTLLGIKVLSPNEWTLKQDYCKNFLLTLILTHKQSSFKEHFHEMELTRILYRLYGSKSEVKDTSFTAGFHFRFIYGYFSFDTNSYLSPLYRYFIKEETRDLAKEYTLAKLISIIFQVLHTLELSWDLFRFKHNNLTLDHMSVINSPHDDANFVYYRKNKEVYVLPSGKDEVFIKISMDIKSTICASGCDYSPCNDVKSFIHSLIDHYGVDFEKNTSYEEVSLFKPFLLLCYHIGVRHGYINRIFNRLEYNNTLSNERQWKDSEITPWKCLNESKGLFDHLKMVNDKYPSGGVAESRNPTREQRQNKFYMNNNPGFYVRVNNPDEKRVVTTPKLIPLNLNWNSNLRDVLRITNKLLSDEMNQFYRSFDGIDQILKRSQQVKYQITAILLDIGDDTSSGIYFDKSEPFLAYYNKKEKPQGRSQSLINEIVKPRGWILKRLGKDPTTNERDPMEVDGFNNSITVSNALSKTLVTKDCVISPNFMKIHPYMFYASEEGKSYLCQLCERSDHSINDYLDRNQDEFMNDRIQSILFQMCHSIETAYIATRFLHRDLNIYNVMLTVITEGSNSILSRQNKGKTSYTWLYQRANYSPILYKPFQLTTKENKELDKFKRNEIVKIIDFGNSEVNEVKRTKEDVAEKQKKDMNIFFTQLLMFGIPKGQSLNDSFKELCDKVIAFGIVPEMDTLKSLLETKVAKLHTPTMVKKDNEWNRIGIRIETDRRTIRLKDETLFNQFIARFPIEKERTVEGLLQYKTNAINYTDSEWQMRYDITGSGLVNFPQFSDDRRGLTPTEILDHPYFDSIQCDLSFLYTHECILLSDPSMGIEETPSRIEQIQPLKPLKPPVKPVKPVKPQPTTIEEETGVYDGEKGIIDAFGETCTFEITKNRFSSGSDKKEDCALLSDQVISEKHTFLIIDLRFAQEFQPIWSDLLLRRYKNFIITKESGKSDAIITNITPKRMLIVKLVNKQDNIGKKLPLTTLATNQFLDFVYRYQLTRIISDFKEIPYVSSDLFEKSTNGVIGDETYLIYERMNDNLIPSFQKLFIENIQLAKKLVYTVFNAYMSSNITVNIYTKLTNDCYKISVIQTLRYILHWLKINPLYIPTVLQDVYRVQNNSSKMEPNERAFLDLTRLNEFILAITESSDIRELLPKNQQCDATELFRDLWRVIFDVNHCNESFDEGNTNIYFNPLDFGINRSNINTEDFIKEREKRGYYTNTNLFFITYSNTQYVGKSVLKDGISVNLSFSDSVQVTLPSPGKDGVYTYYLDLVALIVHIGANNSGGSGHYVTYIRIRNKQEGDQWIVYNNLEQIPKKVAITDVPFSEKRVKNRSIETYTPHLGIYMHASYF